MVGFTKLEYEVQLGYHKGESLWMLKRFKRIYDVETDQWVYVSPSYYFLYTLLCKTHPFRKFIAHIMYKISLVKPKPTR